MFEEKIHLRKTSDHPRLDLDQPKTRERPRNRTHNSIYIEGVTHKWSEFSLIKILLNLITQQSLGDETEIEFN